MIRKTLEPFRKDLSAYVVESTCNWRWLVDSQLDAGFKESPGEKWRHSQDGGFKHSNDQSDTRHPAQLLCLGVLPEGYIQPREQRVIRELLHRNISWGGLAR